jgi:hypothetical protein
MKLISIVFIVSLAPSAFANYESKWTPTHSYQVNEIDKNALAVAKNWALSNYDTSKAKYDFEYSIRKVGMKFEVELTPVHINEAGQHIYMLDGEMCLELNQEFKILEYYQCAFPPYRPKKSSEIDTEYDD